jgi:GTP-binding protein HflX
VEERHEPERTILVGIELNEHRPWELEEQLDELEELALTAGATCVARVVQKRGRPDPAYYIGSGKAVEIAGLAEELDAELVVFNDELSPAQQNNLEEVIGGKVIDRTQLILDIFAQRAQSREGQLQVELAQLEYLLPRLVGMGDVLSRLGGGIGTRGPGETKLEVDRRRIRRRIHDLKRAIREVRRNRRQQRKNRVESAMPLVALVGYTNAGKSTLLQRLTGADVLVENRLFATLDPTTRVVRRDEHQPFLVTDTVGFIRSLPHQLVAAFRATLEEVQTADILVHVVDSSHPAAADQIKAVHQVLAELGIEDKPIITALNKLDIAPDTSPAQLPPDDQNTVKLSAKTGYNLDTLLEKIDDLWAGQTEHINLDIPYTQMELVSYIHERGVVLTEEYNPEGIHIEAELHRDQAQTVTTRLKRASETN